MKNEILFLCYRGNYISTRQNVQIVIKSCISHTIQCKEYLHGTSQEHGSFTTLSPSCSVALVSTMSQIYQFYLPSKLFKSLGNNQLFDRFIVNILTDSLERKSHLFEKVSKIYQGPCYFDFHKFQVEKLQNLKQYIRDLHCRKIEKIKIFS